ncbi:hypothetical protein HRbin34_00285 [bacterium HR34]|nr:hypothetical protein HRbin34_00285 [bacterium HR34]
MKQSFLNFPKQFLFEPEIENKNKLRKANQFILCGMGGSALSGWLLKMIDPETQIIIHRDYKLPKLQISELKKKLIILSSFSGNTEETISSFETCKKLKLNFAVVTKGGKLLELAQKNKVPFVKLPDVDTQPRVAIGLSLIAILSFTRQTKIKQKLKKLAKSLNPISIEKQTRKEFNIIKDKIPIIYASKINFPLAYVWKIKFNETGKIPAFCNYFPELNHNEIEGFNYNKYDKHLSENFAFVFIKDKKDHPRIQKRMSILKSILKNKNFPVIEEKIGQNRIKNIFELIIKADWLSYKVAVKNKKDPEKVDLIENFKKLIKK